MNLRKQIFVSFLFVAIVPLLLVNLYLFGTNAKLAFGLYQQNLNNSTTIQVDIIEEHINRMMVRAHRFATALENCKALEAEASGMILDNQAAADEILKFTEETLDSLLVFTLLDEKGSIIYSSGSNSDTVLVKGGAAGLPAWDGQYVGELSMGEDRDCIAIVTPLRPGGRLISIYRNEFFLKTISTHIQIENSNAFLFCRDHGRLVRSKRQISLLPDEFKDKVRERSEAGLSCRIDGEKAEAYYQEIGKTPWILVNYIPARQVYSSIFSYTLVNFAVFVFSLAVVVCLSRSLSRRVLQPMNWLLHAVEQFFLSGRVEFTNDRVSGKTEIGYLAGRFKGLASDMAAVQAKLRESNYLYEAILHSSYESYIAINYRENRIDASKNQLDFLNEQGKAPDTPQKLFDYFIERSPETAQWDRDMLENMILGRLGRPTEGDVGIVKSDGERGWYRILAVPIFDEENALQKTVLHLKNITAQKLEELQLLRSSQRDSLCGLLNKNALIQLSGKHSRAEHEMTAMFFIDLDNFKQVNDCLGHSAGDEVLQAAAGILLDAFRSTDLVCRYGGDEFVVYVSGISHDAAGKKAEHLTRALKMTKELPGKKAVSVSASIGVYMTDRDETVESMIRHADEAMYRAKQNGKAGYCIETGQIKHT